jgi:hypothetical protein
MPQSRRGPQHQQLHALLLAYTPAIWPDDFGYAMICLYAAVLRSTRFYT